MINKITGVGVNSGVNSGINLRKSINFKSETENKNVTVPKIKEDKGLDALAAYNSAIVKAPVISKDKLDVEPLPLITINPEDIKKIEGEKIYSSDGKLFGIIRRDEKTYTVYLPDENDTNLIKSIETYDKYTRNVVKAQYNEIEDGKYAGYSLEENDAVTKAPLRSTYYDENGKLYNAYKYINKPDGQKISICYYYDDKEYCVYSDSQNGNLRISAVFDNNKQLINYSEIRKNKYQNNTTEINFYQGAPINIYSAKETTLPNTMGLDNFLNREELKPAEHFEKPENIKDIDGEKTYYSNGALESNTFNSDNGKTTALFTTEGSCYKIKDDKHSVFYNDYNEIITETLDNGKIKETTLYSKGGKKVKIKDGNSYKELSVDKDGKPSYYEEGIFENDKEKATKYLSFDKGVLNYAREYNV